MVADITIAYGCCSRLYRCCLLLLLQLLLCYLLVLFIQKLWSTIGYGCILCLLLLLLLSLVHLLLLLSLVHLTFSIWYLIVHIEGLPFISLAVASTVVVACFYYQGFFHSFPLRPLSVWLAIRGGYGCWHYYCLRLLLSLLSMLLITTTTTTTFAISWCCSFNNDDLPSPYY